jgi:hypothetical protein
MAPAQPARRAADFKGVRPLHIASLLALLCLTAVGCGQEPLPADTAAPVAQVAPDPSLAIEEPGIEPITARASNGELRVTADVSGRATGGSLVQVSADCDDPGCKTGAQVDAAGRWTARVLLVGAGDRHANVKLVAQSGAQVALGLARLEAKRPKASAAKRRSSRPAASHTQAARTTTTTVAPAPSPATPPVTSPSPGAASQLAMVGDSLSLGTQAPLAMQLSGWAITTDGRTGRPLAEGMRIIRALASPPPVLAVSLFTNDSPANVTALQAAVRETISMQSGHGCVIWATIVRPPQGGRTYDQANAALAQLAAANPSVMRLVPWAQQVAAHPEWVGRDGVHATTAGYAARAQLYASAARSCLT